jgi:tetrahydromethanopterin S-methyltransferase subunit H
MALSTVTTAASKLAALQAAINAEYAGMAEPADKAAFQRRLAKAGLPKAADMSKAASKLDALVSKLKGLPVANRQAAINAAYAGMSEAADKAAFQRRLKKEGMSKAADMSKPANKQDALVSKLKAMMA